MAHPLRHLAILNDEDAPISERVEAALRVAAWARHREGDIPGNLRLYERIVGLWRHLCANRNETAAIVLHHRLRTSRACMTLSLSLPGRQRFYRDYPRFDDVEGPDPRTRTLGAVLRGRFNVYTASLYEFHWEYPIEKMGIRKDLIWVIERDGTRVPMFDWCREEGVIVACSRCGLDITYEVSKDCPWRRRL